MDIDEFPQDFVDRIEAVDRIDVSPEVVHHAAAGMTLLLWRNTDTVETEGHAEGAWNDPDMLRMNTRVTDIIRRALAEVVGDAVGDSGGEVLLEAMRDACELLPSEAMKDSLWDESHRKADFWGSAISTFGASRVLALFTQGLPGMFMTCNRDWWGHPEYPGRVAGLASMSPPEPDTFTERALNCPWELSDEQAQFITDHRYEQDLGSDAPT